MTLTIELLPAGNGDALWIEYGEPVRRILVDGGTKPTWQRALAPRLGALPPGERHFELLVVTHVDGDHIDGALQLLQDRQLGVTFGDVWFNGWRHLPESPLESLGPLAGERLTEELVLRGLPWNGAFDGKAAGAPDDGPLPRRELAGGAVLTVLAPTAAQLARLKPAWEDAVREAGLVPGFEKPEDAPPAAGLERLGAERLPDVEALAATQFDEDSAQANGSSIVLLLEHEGGSLLLGADAFPSVVLQGLDRLCDERSLARLPVGALKVPHHGSRSNVSRELLERVVTKRYLFSSNGATTKHPHPEAVARVLMTAEVPELCFNYESAINGVWKATSLRERFEYDVRYPEAADGGLVVPVE